MNELRRTIENTQNLALKTYLIGHSEILEMSISEILEKIENELKENPFIKIENPKKFKYWTINKKYTRSTDIDKQSAIENTANRDISLYNIIMESINEKEFTEKEKKIIELLISNIGPDGFLKTTVNYLSNNNNEFSSNNDYSFTEEEIEKVRQRIMRLEPIGIGCIDIREFLYIQAEMKFGKDSYEARILKDFSSELADKRFNEIIKRLKITETDFNNILNNLKTLKMKPDIQFIDMIVQNVIPDIFVDIEDDKLKITLNDEIIPDIKLNQYKIELYKNSKDKEEKKLYSKKLKEAMEFIENLRSRNEITYVIATNIINIQQDFFFKGRKYLKPLKLRDIANITGYSISTISRAANEKYIQFKNNIMPLKKFFSPKSKTFDNSKDISRDFVLETIKELIKVEDKNNPLKDEKIAEILKNKGINITRRTVAKYRKMLKIPKVSLRSKIK